jgi:hypothetical protein
MSSVLDFSVVTVVSLRIRLPESYSKGVL